jgi:PAS domain S-box-containing protein
MSRSHWGIVENGMLQRMWGTNRDITEVKQYQMAFVASEQRLTELLEAVHLVAVILDREGSITFCNDYLLRLTGWQAEEIAGKNWFDLMVAPDEREKLRAAFETAASGSRSPAHFVGTLMRRDGQRRLIEWDSVMMRDAEGRVAGSASIGRDITEYRELEAQFRESQKLESIGRLAGGVAHDFNNLLTIIWGYSTNLLEHMDRSDRAYLGLTDIKNAAEKAAALTKQLLTFSRRQVFQPQVLDMNALVEESERMLQRLIGEDIELTVELDPSRGSVLADANHLHQVLINLVVNARDAMPHGGKLTLAVSSMDLDENRAPLLSGIAPGSYVRLIVADTGTGMTKEVRARLFEPFFTTKEPNKGTGLGLSTVYGIIRQCGGHVVVETEQDRGTTFEIFLPRVQEQAPPPTLKLEAPPAIRGGTETILLVEDQQELRALLAALLRRLGYNVLEADTGAHAMQIIERHPGPIHLVVTDVVMPGMSGQELVELVKSAQGDTKVLYISGYGDTPDTGQPPLGDEASSYLQKSFPPEELAAKVREILDRG